MSIPVPTAELSVMLEHCKLMERQLSALLDTPICQEAAFIIGRLLANAFLVREACEYYVNKAAADASKSSPIPEPSHEQAEPGGAS